METYNSQLIEMDKQCSHKKGVMLQYIYEKEVETQRHCLETLYEKKRQKTVELFKERSTKIKDANDR